MKRPTLRQALAGLCAIAALVALAACSGPSANADRTAAGQPATVSGSGSQPPVNCDPNVYRPEQHEPMVIGYTQANRNTLPLNGDGPDDSFRLDDLLSVRSTDGKDHPGFRLVVGVADPANPDKWRDDYKVSAVGTVTPNGFLYSDQTTPAHLTLPNVHEGDLIKPALFTPDVCPGVTTTWGPAVLGWPPQRVVAAAA